MFADPLTLLAFAPAALALNLTPGADMMFCIGQGLKGGWRPAAAASAGVSAACMVHVALAGLGLGAAVAALPWLFEVIRWAGVGYLLWLARTSLRGGGTAEEVPPVRPARAFRDGAVVNLTNPKVVLFVLAFLPQFVRPEGPVLLQFLALGAILSVGGFVVNALAGAFAGRLAQRLRGGRAGRVLGWISAGIFGALAVRLAVMQRS
ncbi:LysE family translocator [Oceaniglobus roseus]|uniref:LysE family translocator n=1 Tax=Oceaniglobus roseus TaxID=1737570 RepID=UPI000C7F4000|nr:LysE family translocator [Kandeliimicrobium roseum]